MRALVFVGPGEMAVMDRPDRGPGPGEVLVAVRAAGICGSDHELQLRDVVAAIRDGRPPAVTGADGLRTVALMDAIYRASRDGGRVLLATEGLAGT